MLPQFLPVYFAHLFVAIAVVIVNITIDHLLG
jgi:hypothetical protein